MARKRRLLVRHPGPNPTESLVGYLLRLTEANGYPTAHYMLADSGMYRAGDSIRIQLLAAITNRTARDLRSIACHTKDKKTGLVLGQPVSRIEVNTDLAPVCPRCVNEKGFMEAHFSLSLMTICPEHKVILKVCPGCTKPLTRERAGLLRCDCGQSLLYAMEPRVPTAVVELLDIVRRKVLSLSAATESASGLPVHALGAMSLRSLLFLIRSFGRRSAGRSGKSELSMDESRIVELAAEALSDWPNNFRKMLDAKAGPASPNKPCKLSKGELSGLYHSIMYGIKRREQSAFVRDELVKYAVERFGVGTGDRADRARIIGDRPQYVIRSEMTARFGVDRRYANRILSKGSVETIKIESAGRRTRLLVDLSNVSFPSSPDGHIYNTDKAAALIGIPRNVLVLLKQFGSFKARYLPPGIRGFHEQDLEAYKAQLLNSVEVGGRDCGSEKTFRLCQLMAGTSIDMMTKAVVIAELHAGRVSAAAGSVETVQAIRIPRDELLSLMRTRCFPDWRVLRGTSWNVSNQYGGISMCQAAREIGCNNATVRVLVDEGRLCRTSGNGCAMWVSEESVDTFRAQFESLLSVARQIQSRSSVVRRVCLELDIPLLDVSPGIGSCVSFIRKEDIPKMLAGRPQVRFVGRHTRLRWTRFAEVKAVGGTGPAEVGMDDSQTSARALADCAA
jgi:hypothetical protein